MFRRNLHSVGAFLVISLSGLLVCGAAAPKDKDDDWKLLGETKVAQRAEGDEIAVGADAGVLSKIKLEVRGADVEFKSARVVYASGKDDDIEVRDKVKKGEQTRPIDLKGAGRTIKKVVLLYKADHADRDARVVLFGKR
jgi:hypothetical protein